MSNSWLERALRKPRESKLHKLTQKLETVIEDTEEISTLRMIEEFMVTGDTSMPKEEREYIHYLAHRKLNRLYDESRRYN